MKWLPVDLVLVSVFAVIGRMSHAEVITVAGWWSSAWPFLTGVLLGWAVVALTRRPGGSVRAGLVIWAVTVIGGLLLRLVVDQGTATGFVVVATLVLGLLLVGPRALAARDWQGTPRSADPPAITGPLPIRYEPMHNLCICHGVRE